MLLPRGQAGECVPWDGRLEAMERGEPSPQVNGKPGRNKQDAKPKPTPHDNAATTRSFSKASAVKAAQGVSGEVQGRVNVKSSRGVFLFRISGVRFVRELKGGVNNGKAEIWATWAPPCEGTQ